MIKKDKIHREAAKFLKEIEPDIRNALLLNRRFIDIELPKSGIIGITDIHDAYRKQVLEKLDFSLTESIIILSNTCFQANVEVEVFEGETQVEATRRHAAGAYGSAVIHTAENIYKSMWQDWSSGKGDIDEIIREALSD